MNKEFSIDEKAEEILQLLKGLSYRQAEEVIKRINKVLPTISKVYS